MRTQYPNDSFPTISIAVNGGIVPSDGLAVDGSTRTLTSLIVVPATGSTVGAAVGGSDVADAARGGVDGRVAVTNSSVGRAGVVGGVTQPTVEKMITDHRKISFRMSR